MHGLSFVWTSAALVAGRKTVTRRDWDARYAADFHAGDLAAAYDRQPRYGGKPIATIRLTAAPAYEPMAAMPDGDYEGEGHAFYHEHPELLPKTIQRVRVGAQDFDLAHFRTWQARDYSMWVVRFELVSVADDLEPKLARAAALRAVTV